MKKIVTLAAIAALAGGLIFADEPVADVSVAEFKGDASVSWGVDLDAGKTGFKNEESSKFKVNLFKEGDKSTSSDEDIWAELKIKAKNINFKAENGADGAFDDKGKVEVDKAMFHIFKFYVGIRSGNTVTGAYKFDGAIRSADHDNAKWIDDVGPEKYTEGIVAGYADDNLDIALDFRSKKGTNTYWTNDYAIALEAQLKDSNAFVPGLFVKLGGSVNLTDETFDNDGKTGKATRTYNFEMPNLNGFNGSVKPGYYDDVKSHVWGYSAQAGYKLKLDDTYYVKPAVAFAGTTKTLSVKRSYTGTEAIDKVGGLKSADIDASYFSTSMDLAFGALFGWGDMKDDNAGVPYLDGDMAKKITPGVSVVVELPLFTQTETKSTVTTTANVDGAKTYTENFVSKETTDKPYLALITPSFFSGSLINENLKIAAYSEIALMRGFESRDNAEYRVMNDSYYKNNGHGKDGNEAVDANATSKDVTVVTNKHASPVNANNAFAFALGLAYDLKLDAVTVTPKFGVRFANGSYFDNKINEISPLASNKVFEEGWGKMGVQRKVYSNGWGAANEVYAGDFLNLKLRCDVAGLLDNTTFWAEYASANLLNDINYKDEFITVNGEAKTANPYYNKSSDGWNNKWYNVRAGQITVGTKISF